MAYTTISKSTLQFNTVTYSGTTNTSDAITGVGFQPDLVWLKSRSNAGWHWWTDAVRGVTKTVYPNADTVEQTNADGLTAFNADGFTIGNNTDINGSGKTFCSWSWKAGTTSGLSGGTITPSSYSINSTAGFSVMKYTGTGSNGTIAHGLSSPPKWALIKKTSASGDGLVYHVALGATKYEYFNQGSAQATASTMWNDTAPTNSLFSLGTHSLVNGSGVTYIAYFFADVVGYSRHGTYNGNANADGPFIYTGFRPNLVILKNYQNSNNENWVMHDVKRPGYNGNGYYLYPNQNYVEAANNSSHTIDILSNGFKVRSSNDQWNENLDMHFSAWAEQPLVGSNNIPATAR